MKKCMYASSTERLHGHCGHAGRREKRPARGLLVVDREPHKKRMDL